MFPNHSSILHQRKNRFNTASSILPHLNQEDHQKFYQGGHSYSYPGFGINKYCAQTKLPSRAFENMEVLGRNVDRNIPLTKAETNWFGGKPPSEAPQVPKSFQEFSNYGIQITQPDNPGILQHVSMLLSYQQPGYSAIHIDAPSFSSLNPNAKVFTPLNPNAKEFTPSKSKLAVEKESNLCNGSTKCDSQSGALTKTPETSSLEVECPKATDDEKEVFTLQSSPPDLQPDPESLCASQASPPQPESNCSTATLATEPSLRATTDHLRTHVKSLSCEDMHRDKDNVETDDDSDDDLFGNGVYDDSDEDDLERDGIRRFSESSGDDKTSSRHRSLSVCSDSSFIEFSASSPGEQPTVIFDNGIDWQVIDSDDESEENEAEESGGWDEVDQTEDDEIDFNEKMIILGFIHPLLMHQPNSVGTGSKTQASSKRMVINNVPTASDQDVYPSKVPVEEIEKRILEANLIWTENYKDTVSCDTSSPKTSFSPPECWVYIDEDPLLAEDLRESRINDLSRRKADMDRMERLLGPIFDQSHREKIWNKVHAGGP